MSDYVALLDGGKREESIQVAPSGPGLYEVRLGGQLHRVDAFQEEDGAISLLVDGASYAVLLDRRDDGVRVHLRGSIYPIEILDERRLRMRRSAGKFTVAGRQLLTAPMPGKVVKLLVRVGEQVREGQGIAVVEAMKMENEMRSPKEGVVVEIHVSEGQAVETGAKLAAIE